MLMIPKTVSTPIRSNSFKSASATVIFTHWLYHTDDSICNHPSGLLESQVLAQLEVKSLAAFQSEIVEFGIAGVFSNDESHKYSS